jgi:hypothetical protein
MEELITAVHNRADSFVCAPTTSHGAFFNAVFEELIADKGPML